MNHFYEVSKMEWLEKFTPKEQEEIRKWMWALNKKNPQNLPGWYFPATILLGPLVVLFYDHLAGNSLRLELPIISIDFLIYATTQVAASIIALVGVPFLRLKQ